MDIGAIIQTWLGVLTRPGEETFAQEKARPEANLTTAIIWIVIAAVVAAILGWLRGMLFIGSTGTYDQLLQQMNLPPEMESQVSSLLAAGVLGAATGAASLFGIVVAPILFLIAVGIRYLVGSLLKGEGDFGNYAYLNAAYQAPISILSSLLAFLPFVGGCIGGLLSLYGLVLAFFAAKVGLNLTDGKAIVVVLVPLLIGVIIFGCFAAAIASLVVGLNA